MVNKGPPRTLALNDFGKRVRELVAAQFPSRSAFLREMGLSAATLHRYETTDRRPSGSMLLKMAARLNVTPAYLLGGWGSGEDIAHHGYGGLLDHASALAAYLLKIHGDPASIPPADEQFLEHIIALHPIFGTLLVAHNIDRLLPPPPKATIDSFGRPRTDRLYSTEARQLLPLLLAPRARTGGAHVLLHVTAQWKRQLRALLETRPDLAPAFSDLPAIFPTTQRPESPNG